MTMASFATETPRGHAASPFLVTDWETGPICASNASVFSVSRVVNASGGRTGCFLYRGTLLTPLPAVASPASEDAPSRGGRLADDDELEAEAIDWAEYEGQELSLYFSYEELSPRAKQRGQAPEEAAAPWRAILRDSRDELVFCLRGLPHRARLDAKLRLVTWGPSIAVAFPTAEDAEAFAANLCRVAVQRASLAGSPQAALLADATPERAQVGSGSDADASSGLTACPASPSRHGDGPWGTGVGLKRKASTASFGALATPLVRPRFASAITPCCSCDLGPQ